MDDDDAVDALTRLGLTTYEARALVALQKLGTGTASEVSEVADVPRSQVYGAAERLSDRGLIEVHQSTPTQYRPVPLAEAKDKLLRELEAEGERAFEYLQSVEGSEANDEGRRSEAVWTVSGADAIAARTAELAADAQEHVIYGTSDPAHLDPEVIAVLEERAESGVDVLVTCQEPSGTEALADADGAEVLSVAPEDAIGTGRILVVDRDGVLLSVAGGDSPLQADDETAIWSADSAFAAVIVSLAEEWAETHLPTTPA
jgi:sugar-specific transcriptional regulator TrmB